MCVFLYIFLLSFGFTSSLLLVLMRKRWPFLVNTQIIIWLTIFVFSSAICPYLALETCRQWRLSNKTVNLMRNGKMPTVTIEQAQKNFCKVCILVRSECAYCFC